MMTSNEDPSWETITIRRAEAESERRRNVLFSRPSPHIGCRGKETTTNNNMYEFTREQREGFMRFLQDAKTRKQTELQRDLDRKVKEEVLPKIMQRQGLVKLVEQVGTIGSRLSQAAVELQQMDVFGRPPTLWGKILGTEEGIEDVVEKMKRPYNEQAEAELRNFDRAILRVLSAASLEEAQQIVNDLV